MPWEKFMKLKDCVSELVYKVIIKKPFKEKATSTVICQMGLLVLTLLRGSIVMLVVSEKPVMEEALIHCEAAMPCHCSRTEVCLSTHRQEDLCCPYPCAEQKGVATHQEPVGPVVEIISSWAL